MAARNLLNWTSIGTIILCFASIANAATIDSFTFNNFNGERHTPGATIGAFGLPDTYAMNDGSTWHSGAGTFYFGSLDPISEAVTNGVLSVTLLPTFVPSLYNYPSNIALFYSDFGNGYTPRTQAEFDFAGQLTLTAVVGSTTATLAGNLTLVENMLDYPADPLFRYFSFPVGSTIGFSETVTMVSDPWIGEETNTWHPGVFGEEFEYELVGQVPALVPEPSCLFLIFVGFAFCVTPSLIVQQLVKFPMCSRSVAHVCP
jgi:hypothetical protein